MVENFTKNFEQYLVKWYELIKNIKESQKKIAIWGAASKGVIFLQHMKKVGIYFDCVIDINPNKQGCYIPCIGTQIIKPEYACKYNLDTIIVANPLYLTEVHNHCKILGLNVKIIPLE